MVGNRSYGTCPVWSLCSGSLRFEDNKKIATETGKVGKVVKNRYECSVGAGVGWACSNSLGLGWT